MLRLHGKPFLEYIIIELKKQGFKNLFLLCGYQTHRLIAYFRNGSKWGVHISYSIEKRPMGTGGAIKSAEPLIGSKRSFLVLNGDTFLRTNLHRLISFHRKNKASITMVLAKPMDKIKLGRSYGSILLNHRKEVLRFSEKIPIAGSILMNAGIYVIHPRVLKKILPRHAYSLEKKVFPQFIGNRFYGWPVRGSFIDIGTVSRYKSASRKLKPLRGLT